ncbi:MAG: single-stranded DNA-binding protein, partial [Spirochaetes bacterium]|nr:single-stranded DNA-binding protein [Spirochaetota bacterium]
MRNFNLVVLEGNLVSDPEIRSTQNGTALCTFSIASNYSFYRDEELQEEVYFLDVTVWAKLAELCNEHLKKGRRVIVNGRIKQSKWLDDDGGTHSKISIVGNQVQFLDFKDSQKDEAELSEENVPF